MKPSLLAGTLFARLLALGLLSILAFSAPGLAQSTTSQSYRLSTMKFTGLNRFSDAQASKATGLQTGDSVTQAQLAAAVDTLAKSGAFDNVSFSLFDKRKFDQRRLSGRRSFKATSLRLR